MDAPEMTSTPLVPPGQQQSQQQQQAPPQAPSLAQPDAPRKASAPAASSSSSSSSTTASAAPFDAETMQDQLALFVRDGLLDSAQILGELLVALANAAAAGVVPPGAAALSRTFHGASFRLFADLLVAKREFKRALQYYKRSWKIQIGSTNASASPEAVALKVKMGECWIAMDGAHQAIEVLNSVPVPLRSLTVHLLLGKLYLSEGLVNKAEESYRAAVRLNPYALEATLALADITATREAKSVATPSSAPGNLGNVSGLEGAPSSVMNSAFWQKELETFYAKLAITRVPASGSPPVTSRDAEWLQTLATAHVHANRGRHRAASEAFNAVNRLFPHNLHCVLHKGKLDMEQEFYHEAHKCFDRARQIDDQNLRMMDAHADCLRRSNAPTSLNTLVQHLFDTSEDHVESWLAGAFFCDMKGEHETALQFCDRAIAINRRYAPAYLFRGTLLLQQMRPELAAQAFKESCKLSKTLEAYSGMVTSYCEMSLKGLNKYKEALTTAKTVVKLYPQKAQSYVLLGNVLALRPETADQAKKAYQRAHAADPRKLAAVFGLVDLLVREGNVPLAVERLQAFCDQTPPREEVLTKLADVYTLNKQFQEAIGFYHRALSANPSSADAARGLDRLEKIMRGEDPDELNSTMEHMEGDEQDDSMDAGEYVTS